MASSQLVWQLIKGNNAYLKKNLNNTWFSTEKGNVANRHSYKYSGLANDKAVGVAAALDDDDDKGVEVTLKGKKGKFHTYKTQKRVKRAVKSVGSEVQSIRPDLVKPAKAATASAAAAARRAAVVAQACLDVQTMTCRSHREGSQCAICQGALYCSCSSDLSPTKHFDTPELCRWSAAQNTAF
eukprot:TRINITY_DN2149_c0_g1_i7.p1 TRINITY_DN2149_c0_g1~~TRINITY_DN2149_c0_g1_i7.p1  ORF type:complete len:213 (+),score=15.48 TRINITY_DN2149_c0_g1_i7:93-641(+)